MIREAICSLGIALMTMVCVDVAVKAQVEFDVATLIGDRITDVDEGAVQGIAIIDSSPGWEYSLDDQATWHPITDHSLLLNFPAWIRHPDTEPTIGGRSPWIEYRAWDQTQGIIGGTFDIGETGGSTAFSVNSLPVVFSLADAQVDEDLRLQIGVKAFSASRNLATLTDVTYTITPPEFGTWQPRVATDDPKIAGHFQPSGILGVCELKVEGKNKRGKVVTPGKITIEVVVGAAQVIEVTALEQVER